MQLKVHFNPSWRRDFPPGDRRLWLLRSVALRIQLQANPLWLFEVYYRRLLVAVAALAVVLWLLAATALFVWLNRDPHNQVRWPDLAAPWRWSSLQARRGDTVVLTALDQLKSHDFAAAFYNLRVGVARSPANVEGRLAFASLLAGSDPARAVAFMEEGLPLCRGSARYLGGLLALYARLQIQSHALEVIAGQLGNAAGPLPPDARFILQRGQVAVLLQLARYAEAEQVLAAITPPAPADAADLRSLRVELLLRSGRAAEAKQLRGPDPVPAVAGIGQFMQAADIAIALDDAEALSSVLRRMKARAPDDPGVYLFAFRSWHRLNRLSYRDAAEQEYLRLFAGNEGALQAIAALAVNLDLPDVVSRAQRTAVAARLSPFAFQVHQTELALRRGDIELATRRLRDWENNVDTLANQQRFYPEFIKRLTRAAFAGTPDQVSFLLSHLAANRGPGQLSAYGLAVDVLDKAGNPAGAAQVLQAGLRLYPLSEPLLAARVRTDAMLAARTSASAAPVAAAAVPVVVPLPGTADGVRARLDTLFQQDALAEARDLLRAIQAQRPAWSAGLEPELAAREVELAFLSLDPLASRGAVRTYLDRHHTQPDLLRLVGLVGRLAARGRVADARLLSDEVVAARGATAAVQQALHDLNLADDLAAVAADQAATLAALDRDILGQQWLQADRLLKYLRDRPPAWLAAAQTDLRVREVQIRLGLDQRPLALGVLKDLVIRGGAPRSAAFKLVRDLLAREENDSAVLLAREIVKLLPEDQAAARLLLVAEAPKAPE